MQYSTTVHRESSGIFPAHTSALVNPHNRRMSEKARESQLARLALQTAEAWTKASALGGVLDADGCRRQHLGIFSITSPCRDSTKARTFLLAATTRTRCWLGLIDPRDEQGLAYQRQPVRRGQGVHANNWTQLDTLIRRTLSSSKASMSRMASMFWRVVSSASPNRSRPSRRIVR